tara:strand:- start:362 stop:1381 length:1020 start_codon:yes stop_codon:yes gene_type:complete
VIAEDGQNPVRLGLGAGDQQAAAGLRIGYQRAILGCETVGQRDLATIAGPVAPRSAGHEAAGGKIARARQQRHRRPVQPQRATRSARHFQRVTGQPEPRHIGHRMNARQSRQIGTGRVQPRDGFDHHCVILWRQGLFLQRRREDANPQRLAQDHHIARFRARVAPDMIGMDQAKRHQAIDRLDRINAVAAADGNARIAAGHRAAFEDAGDGFGRQPVDRHSHQRQGHDRGGAHGIDIADRVGRGDAAEIQWIVHDRHEEIGRGHQCLLIVQPIDRGIVGCLDAHQQLVRDRQHRGSAQQAGQHAGRDLAPAAAAMGQRGQARFGRALVVHRSLRNFGED